MMNSVLPVSRIVAQERKRTSLTRYSSRVADEDEDEEDDDDDDDDSRGGGGSGRIARMVRSY